MIAEVVVVRVGGREGGMEMDGAELGLGRWLKGVRGQRVVLSGAKHATLLVIP